MSSNRWRLALLLATALASASAVTLAQQEPLRVALAALPWGGSMLQPGGTPYRLDLHPVQAVELDRRALTFHALGTTNPLIQTPTRLAADGQHLYLVLGGRLFRWSVVDRTETPASLVPVPVPGAWQEVSDLAAGRGGLWLLSSSGDLFWHANTGPDALMVPASPATTPPDPLVLTLDQQDGKLATVDVANGQLLWPRERRWADATPKSPPRGFRQALRQGVSLAISDEGLYLLTRRGDLWRMARGDTRKLAHLPTVLHANEASFTPVRMRLAHGRLWILDAAGYQLIACDLDGGVLAQYLLPQRHAHEIPRDFALTAERLYVLMGAHLMSGPWPLPEVPAGPQDRTIWLPRYRSMAALQGFRMPVDVPALPKPLYHYPNTRRIYRHGVHQGVDFFDDRDNGLIVDWGSPVRAAKAGTVLRADGPSRWEIAREYRKLLDDCKRFRRTSVFEEHCFRGRQVWLQHDQGVVSRYAHLSRLAEGLSPGQQVQAGQIIGYVGNTGTSDGIKGTHRGAHLHFEIWLAGGDWLGGTEAHYLGEGLDPRESQRLWSQVLGVPVVD